MRPELVKQLLKNIIEPLVNNDEAEAEKLLNELQFLGEYKYDYYEMYAPGRHFLENFYLWIKQFDVDDRPAALDLVRKYMIFISRGEFELLSRVLYWEIVRKIQFALAARDTGLPIYKVSQIAKSVAFEKIERSSLYIGMSDGARLDYFRRQNPDISHEQILLSYHVDQSKCKEMVDKLEKKCGKGSRFRQVFLIDDFCASGRTLIRVNDKDEIEGTLLQLESKVIQHIQNKDGIENMTLLKSLLAEDSEVYLCPMLATEKAITNVDSHKSKLSSTLKNLIIRPAVILGSGLSTNTYESPIGNLCKKYYQDRMGDEHTGDVSLGYDTCGLPLVLHHNTPNNSLYLLWNRKAMEQIPTLPSFQPLFIRIERHRSAKS